MLTYKNFIKESKEWIYEGNFKYDESCIKDGKFIKDKIPTKILGNFSSLKMNTNKYGLISLEGSPIEVHGTFNCSYNDLTSLEGGPIKVTGKYICSHTKITNLKGLPSNIENGIDLSYNFNIKSLEGSPKNIKKSFDCSYNRLTSLEGGPSKILGNFLCNHNRLTSLEGGPIEVGKNYYCHDNNLKSLEYSPKKLKDELFYNNNEYTNQIDFINSVSYVSDYYSDLFKYMINNKLNLNDVETWPEGFLNDNIKTSVKSINRFKI